jgi:APA family basic amino acid/polyamine antiporter
MDPAALGKSEAPLSDAVKSAVPHGGTILAVTALFATASTALITMVAISRLLFSMARDRFLPKPLSRLLPGRQTPWVAALVLFTAAGLLVPLGEVKIIASISSFGILIIFIAVQSAVILLRHRHPRLARGFTVPLSIGRTPLPPVLGICMALVLLTQFEMKVYAIGCGVIALAALAYVVWKRVGK